MIKTKFVHLNIHTDYSIIDGLAKVESIIQKAKKLNMPAIAITDFTNLFGLIKFYTEAQKNGIKPIIGSDFYLKNELLEKEISHLTILAKNNVGYKNLILLISNAYKNGFDINGPTIKKKWLTKYKKGLLLISGAQKGDLGKLLIKGNKTLIKKCLKFYQKHFFNNFYLELTKIGHPEEEYYLKLALNLAHKKSIPVVATNHVRFLKKNDFKAHEIRVAIENRSILSDPNRKKNYTQNQYLKSQNKMIKLFSDVPEAIKNTIEISKRCNVTIKFGKRFLPKLKKKNKKSKTILIEKAKIGLEKRLKIIYPNQKKRHKKRNKYDKRLKKELKIINNMGFPGYFLIIMEFVKWAKKNQIPVGPGRGSGAGSLVAYSLEITDLNPIKFNLLFERFLNPERISIPDFDIDFCMEKRDKVIEHVMKVYGSESVSQIITFGTMAARAAIKDVGRVLNHSYIFADRISKLIPIDPGMTLKKALSIEPELKKMYKSEEEVKLLINFAQKLEGVTRNIGKHAGGVIIAPKKITNFTPIYCDQNGQNQITHFDKKDIEKIGLVKFDFLGLKTLTIINLAIKIINKTRSKKKLKPINIININLNDSKCFDNLKKAKTTAVFQLESRGMKDLIKKLKPDCFEDIIALVALFRPGPLKSGMVNNFINRKHGLEKISYPDHQWQHQLLKPILQPTYGIILYQEQVMQITQVLFGYTLGEADVLRRKMSKKNSKEIKKQKINFKKKAIKNKIHPVLAMKIFNLLEKFASYGFNKSHSTAYALISYQTLWLKTHYPAEFMSAALTADMDNIEKIAILIDECYKIGLKILPPNINNSLYEFHPIKNKIVYGIGAIKGVGEIAINEIIKSRKLNGPFKNIFDLCSRINIKKINRRIMKKLIMSGAFDELGPHRSALMSSLEDALKAAEQHSKFQSIGQIDMFGILSESKKINIPYKNIKKWTKKTILKGEKETLGLYLTGHPITEYLKEIKHYTNGKRLKDIKATKKGKISKVIGLLLTSKIITTKKGKKIGLCTLDDYSGKLDIVLFSKTLKKYKSLLKIDKILLFLGKIKFDSFDNTYKMTAYKIMKLEEIREKYAKCIKILIQKKKNKKKHLSSIYKILNSCYPGKTEVFLYFYHKEKTKKINTKKRYKILPTEKTIDQLKNVLGKKHIKIQFH